MSKEEYKQGIINNLKEIIKTAQSNIDAIYTDDDFSICRLDYKSVETCMNYIRLSTQRVQWNMKNYKEYSCDIQNPDV